MWFDFVAGALVSNQPQEVGFGSRAQSLHHGGNRLVLLVIVLEVLLVIVVVVGVGGTRFRFRFRSLAVVSVSIQNVFRACLQQVDWHDRGLEKKIGVVRGKLPRGVEQPIMAATAGISVFSRRSTGHPSSGVFVVLVVL